MDTNQSAGGENAGHKLQELHQCRRRLGEILDRARALGDPWGNRYVIPYLEMVTTDQHAYPLMIGSFDEWIRLAELNLPADTKPDHDA